MQNEHQTVQWTSNADSVHKWERETNFHPNPPHNELCLFCFQFAFNVSFFVFFLGGGRELVDWDLGLCNQTKLSRIRISIVTCNMQVVLIHIYH